MARAAARFAALTWLRQTLLSGDESVASDTQLMQLGWLDRLHAGRIDGSWVSSRFRVNHSIKLINCLGSVSGPAQIAQQSLH